MNKKVVSSLIRYFLPAFVTLALMFISGGMSINGRLDYPMVIIDLGLPLLGAAIAALVTNIFIPIRGNKSLIYSVFAITTIAISFFLLFNLVSSIIVYLQYKDPQVLVFSLGLFLLYLIPAAFFYSIVISSLTLIGIMARRIIDWLIKQQTIASNKKAA